jgi:hypothetical protein
MWVKLVKNYKCYGDSCRPNRVVQMALWRAPVVHPAIRRTMLYHWSLVCTTRRGFINRSVMEGSLCRFVKEGEHDGAIRDGSSTSLPSFRSHSGGGIVRGAIIYYNGNKRSVTMCVRASRASPRRLIKATGFGITAVSERIYYGVLG